jgi:hypothetical protein
VNTWTCPHGFGEGSRRGDCDGCNADIAGRPHPVEMSGDQRAEEVRSLLNDANAYRVGDMHQRIEALVGRPVWTHEFATDTRLIEEARGALPHPADLAAHAVESMKALMDGKPVHVVRVPK